MVKIRLRRIGAKKQPVYRVVVADARSPRNGRFIETIGHYNPRTDPVTLTLKEDRALHWLSVGAQPTDTVLRLFQNLGTMERFARLKQGEELEKLLTEARAAHAQAEAERAEAVAPAKTKAAPAKPAAPAEPEVEEAVAGVAVAEAPEAGDVEAETEEAVSAEETDAAAAEDETSD